MTNFVVPCKLFSDPKVHVADDSCTKILCSGTDTFFYDESTNEDKLLLGLTNPTFGRISSDGSRIFLSGTTSDGQIFATYVYDGNTGAKLFELPGQILFATPNGRCVVLSNCWENYLTVIMDEDSGIRFVSTISVSQISNDGKRVLSANGDLWDVDAGTVIKTFEAPASSLDLNFIMASGSLWSGKTGEKICSLSMSSNDILECISLDGLRFITQNGDGFSIWSAKTGNLIKSISLNVEGIDCSAVKVSIDGRRILTIETGYKLTLWNGETGEKIRELKGHPISTSSSSINCICMSRSGNRIAISFYMREEYKINVYLWDGDSGQFIQSIKDADISQIFFSADGNRMLTCGAYTGLTSWDGNTGKKIREFDISNRFVVSNSTKVCKSSNNSHIVMSSSNDVVIWDVNSKSVIHRMRCPSDNMCISPDGRFLVTCGDSTYIWDVKSGKKLNCINEYTISAFVSLDSNRIMCNGSDFVLSMSWNYSKLKCKKFLVKDGCSIFRMSADGSIFIAYGNREIGSYDANTGKKVKSVEFDGSVVEMAISPDSTRFLVETSDEFAFWNLPAMEKSLVIKKESLTSNSRPDFCTNYWIIGCSTDSMLQLDMWWLLSGMNVLESFVVSSSNFSFVDFPSTLQSIANYVASQWIWHRNAKYLEFKNFAMEATPEYLQNRIQAESKVFLKDSFVKHNSKSAVSIARLSEWNCEIIYGLDKKWTSGVSNFILSEHDPEVHRNISECGSFRFVAVYGQYSFPEKFFSQDSDVFTIWDNYSGTKAKEIKGTLVSHCDINYLDQKYLRLLRIFVTRNGNQLELWETSSGNKIKDLEWNHWDEPITVSVSYSHILVVGDTKASLFDREGNVIKSTLNCSYRIDTSNVQFTDNSKYFLTSAANWMDFTCTIWDASNGEIIKEFHHVSRATLCCVKDLVILESLLEKAYQWSESFYEVKIVDCRTGTVMDRLHQVDLRISYPSSKANSLQFSDTQVAFPAMNSTFLVSPYPASTKIPFQYQELLKSYHTAFGNKNWKYEYGFESEKFIGMFFPNDFESNLLFDAVLLRDGLDFLNVAKSVALHAFMGKSVPVNIPSKGIQPIGLIETICSTKPAFKANLKCVLDAYITALTLCYEDDDKLQSSKDFLLPDGFYAFRGDDSPHRGCPHLFESVDFHDILACNDEHPDLFLYFVEQLSLIPNYAFGGNTYHMSDGTTIFGSSSRTIVLPSNEMDSNTPVTEEDIDCQSISSDLDDDENNNDTASERITMTKNVEFELYETYATTDGDNNNSKNNGNDIKHTTSKHHQLSCKSYWAWLSRPIISFFNSILTWLTHTYNRLNNALFGITRFLFDLFFTSQAGDKVPVDILLIPLPNCSDMTFLQEIMNGSERLKNRKAFSNQAIQSIIDFHWNHRIQYMFVHDFLMITILFLAYFLNALLPSQNASHRILHYVLMIVIVFLCGHFFRHEYKQIRVSFRAYWSDSWNIINVSALLMCIATVILQVINYSQSSTNDYLSYSIDMLASCTLPLMGIQSLYYLGGLPATGALVRMIIKITRGIGPFTIILGVVLLSFAGSLTLLFRNQNELDVDYDGYSSYDRALLTTYGFIFSGYVLSDLIQSRNVPLTLTLVMLFMFIVVIILLNLLIALMGDIYDEVQDNAAGETYFARAKLVLEYDDLIPSSAKHKYRDIWYPKYIHVLQRESIFDQSEASAAWMGRMQAIRDETRKLGASINASQARMHQELESFKADVLESINKALKK